MPELAELSTPRTPADADHIQRNILEEHVELWWFQDPKKSILCYGVAVVLILACGIGGIILLKQLLSSAIQDMNCIRSRDQIELLKSGGFSDCLVLLLSALVLLVCGIVLTVLSTTRMQLSPLQPLGSMFTSGIILLAAGSTILLSLLLYVLCTSCCQAAPRGLDTGEISVFTISGRLAANRRLPPTSSMANLI
ncbi:transmembrane protein 125 isoform X2 [Nothoprocta perdicaria]|uniref:transmembrane protein 125 isoform X2 n=1 Tax=Nothoprocta perdicaria TaxID=30464 RepID=UPI000E1B781E|nr:transmembrane protein 125 isoform X2 [Nothoprocta perdicaria]